MTIPIQPLPEPQSNINNLLTPLNPTAMDHHSPKPYWRFSKHDFFPEHSFQNLAAYKSAFSQTLHRLHDRCLGRSTDANELIELKKQSENEMRKCLTWIDLIWLGFGSVVGSGIFTITGLEARNDAGPSIVLSYALSGLSALFSVFCYTEFAVEIPIAGGSFSFLRVELGDFIAFIAAGNILLEAVAGAAGLARSFSSYFASMFNSNPDFLRIRIDSFAEGITALWGANVKGWVGYGVGGGLWFAGVMGMAVVRKQRVPKVWGVPLVPWLPALSILMNVFLIGSLGGIAFKRFFICSGVMLVYYLLVGVHATYDLAHQDPAESTIEKGKENIDGEGL